jgi:hypothetical protein
LLHLVELDLDHDSSGVAILEAGLPPGAHSERNTERRKENPLASAGEVGSSGDQLADYLNALLEKTIAIRYAAVRSAGLEAEICCATLHAR